jgi:hypothetical protein
MSRRLFELRPLYHNRPASSKGPLSSRYGGRVARHTGSLDPGCSIGLVRQAKAIR